MAKCCCDYRFLLLLAAVPFIYIQMRLFTAQSQYADRLADAIESENQCTRQTRLLIDQISMQQGQIIALEEQRKRQDKECEQLRALIQDLESIQWHSQSGDEAATTGKDPARIANFKCLIGEKCITYFQGFAS